MDPVRVFNWRTSYNYSIFRERKGIAGKEYEKPRDNNGVSAGMSY